MTSLSALPPFQLLNLDNPDLPALLGPLYDFIGTWTNEPNQGWNLIAVPGPLQADAPITFFNSNHGFFLETIPYVETITFTPIAVTLNRGSFVPATDQEEQIQQIGALLYEQTIIAAGVDEANPNYAVLTALLASRGFAQGIAIHAERGMLLNLLNFQDSDSGTMSIARMGTIPHGNAILCLGNVTAESSPQIDAQGTSVTPTVVWKDQALPLDYQVNTYLPPAHTLESFPFYPHFTPFEANQTLINANQNINFVSTNHIALSTENSGGILSIPFVGQAIGKQGINTTKMTVDYWVSKISDAQGVVTTRLQYVQNINLIFPASSAPTVPVNWPHIALNTLYKQVE